MGDLVAALDAAAHAAVAYRNVGRRGSAYGCTARQRPWLNDPARVPLRWWRLPRSCR
jgi:hypothetical protein